MRFREAIRDDLNAPRALALVGDVLRDEALSEGAKRTLINDFDGWLGLDLLAGPLEEEQESDPRIDALVQAREEARSARDFAEADRIRDALLEEGIKVEDTPDGPVWRREK